MSLDRKVLDETLVERLKFYAGMRKDYIHDPKRYQVDEIVFKLINDLKGDEGKRKMDYIRKYYDFVRQKP